VFLQEHFSLLLLVFIRELKVDQNPAAGISTKVFLQEHIGISCLSTPPPRNSEKVFLQER
jgi:hypothetical protein